MMTEQALGFCFMQQLSERLPKQALLYDDMMDPGITEDGSYIWNGRSHCGTFEDNHIIPYKGHRLLS
jgi:hypothetical protein